MIQRFFYTILCIMVIASASGAGAPTKPNQNAEEKEPAKVLKWKSLFDGTKLGKWETVKRFDFNQHGKVEVKDGCIVLNEGNPATGVRWSGEFPKIDYELNIETQRVEGSDFFCGLTFPVGDSWLTLIMGGWRGWIVGLSCIDGYYAIDNETCHVEEFKNNKWYKVRICVTKPRINVFLNGKLIIELETKDRKLETSWEMESCRPLGVASWHTTGAIRKIRYRLLNDETGSNTKNQ